MNATEEIKEEWKDFYATHFDILVRDIDEVVVPGYSWPSNGLMPILIPRGETLGSLRGSKKSTIPINARVGFNISSIGDGRIAMDMKRNNLSKSYFVWVKKDQDPEPIPYHETILANDPSMEGITLLEMYIFQLKYFLETGKYVNYYTFCSGSRCLFGGSVPEFRIDDDPRYGKIIQIYGCPENMPNGFGRNGTRRVFY